MDDKMNAAEEMYQLAQSNKRSKIDKAESRLAEELASILGTIYQTATEGEYRIIQRGILRGEIKDLLIDKGFTIWVDGYETTISWKKPRIIKRSWIKRILGI